MNRATIRQYYDARYSSDHTDTFPLDRARYRAWFGSLLQPAPRTSTGSSRPGSDSLAVLDFGCGVGYVCSEFLELGYEATGVDISSAALEIAREREPRGTFIEAAEDGALPFPDVSFDVVACLGVLEHIPDPAPIVAELRRVAREDATGVWVLPNARSPFFWFGRGTGQVEEHPRSLAGWTELLEAGGWTVTSVRRDPGPLDRPVAGWKRALQAGLNRLSVELTYQFVLHTRPG